MPDTDTPGGPAPLSAPWAGLRSALAEFAVAPRPTNGLRLRLLKALAATHRDQDRILDDFRVHDPRTRWSSDYRSAMKQFTSARATLDILARHWPRDLLTTQPDSRPGRASARPLIQADWHEEWGQLFTAPDLPPLGAWGELPAATVSQLLPFPASLDLSGRSRDRADDGPSLPDLDKLKAVEHTMETAIQDLKHLWTVVPWWRTPAAQRTVVEFELGAVALAIADAGVAARVIRVAKEHSDNMVLSLTRDMDKHDAYEWKEPLNHGLDKQAQGFEAGQVMNAVGNAAGNAILRSRARRAAHSYRPLAEAIDWLAAVQQARERTAAGG
jgi:hypothetical protein